MLVKNVVDLIKSTIELCDREKSSKQYVDISLSEFADYDLSIFRVREKVKNVANSLNEDLRIIHNIRMRICAKVTRLEKVTVASCSYLCNQPFLHYLYFAESRSVLKKMGIYSLLTNSYRYNIHMIKKHLCNILKALKNTKLTATSSENSKVFSSIEKTETPRKPETEKLSDDQQEIIKEYFSDELVELPEGTKFLHGGLVDFSFYPVSSKPNWLAQYQKTFKSFAFGKDSGRKFETSFSTKFPTRLLQFKVENTAPLATKLGHISSEKLDTLIGIFLKSKEDIDGLIGPTKNVMFYQPEKFIISESYNSEKALEFEAFCKSVNSLKRYELEHLSSGKIVHHIDKKYKVVIDMKVVRLEGSIVDYTDFKALSPEEAFYHFAKLKKSYSVVDVNGFFVEAPFFENKGYLDLNKS